MPIREKPLREDIRKTSILHAILFPKDKYSLNGAKKWLKDNETKNIWRFRIKEQIKGYEFFTKKLNNGVELVFMYRKKMI